MPDTITNPYDRLKTQYPNLFTPMSFEQPAPMEIPKMEMPAIPSPSLVDMGRVSQLTQQFASPAIRSGRAGLREMLARGSRDNPIQQSYRARGAIAGMGDVINTGIANARSPALSVATGEAASQGDINKLGYESALNTNKLAYENAWNTNKMAYESAWKKNLLAYEEAKNLRSAELTQRMSEMNDIKKAAADKLERASHGGGGGGRDTSGYDASVARQDRMDKERQDRADRLLRESSDMGTKPSSSGYTPYTDTGYKYPSESSSGWGDEDSGDGSGSLLIGGQEYYNNDRRGTLSNYNKPSSTPLSTTAYPASSSSWYTPSLNNYSEGYYDPYTSSDYLYPSSEGGY